MQAATRADQKEDHAVERGARSWPAPVHGATEVVVYSVMSRLMPSLSAAENRTRSRLDGRLDMRQPGRPVEQHVQHLEGGAGREGVAVRRTGRDEQGVPRPAAVALCAGNQQHGPAQDVHQLSVFADVLTLGPYRVPDGDAD